MDRILIRKFKPVEKTASGIYIPERAQENLNRGEVMAVGPGAPEHPVSLKVGDRVVLPGFGGASIKLDKGEEEFLLYRESDILAKITE
ncbi:hypothetical protein C9890_0692 [Perkinsus sp. BL_2016]|nr:hypothetical protein C9890_0692 [Perkinsus sp. BL_2016]